MAERKDFETQEAVEWIENPTDIDNMRFTARNDYAFKKLFGRPENIIILQDFLSAVLELSKDKLVDIVIENPAVGNHYQRQKIGILDIKLTLKSGCALFKPMTEKCGQDSEGRIRLWSMRIR